MLINTGVDDTNEGGSRAAYIVDPKRAVMYFLYTDGTYGVPRKYTKEFFNHKELTASEVFGRMGKSALYNENKVKTIYVFRKLLFPDSE